MVNSRRMISQELGQRGLKAGHGLIEVGVGLGGLAEIGVAAHFLQALSRRESLRSAKVADRSLEFVGESFQGRGVPLVDGLGDLRHELARLFKEEFRHAVEQVAIAIATLQSRIEVESWCLHVLPPGWARPLVLRRRRRSEQLSNGVKQF